MIAQWLDLVGQRSVVMGTTGNGFLDNLKTAANTTGVLLKYSAHRVSWHR
ncbi:hypothetical protein O9993_19805 [Vibrio lentus]|nr:hypothetical protein [Vibrio lentus]